MGVDSRLVNMRTREYLDVRGFWRFTSEAVRRALSSTEEARRLVDTYTQMNTRATPEYKEWLARMLLDFVHRGDATTQDIWLLHDNEYGVEAPVDWYSLDSKGFRLVGDVWGLTPGVCIHT